MSALGVGDVAEVVVAPQPAGQLAVAVVTHGPASDCAAVVEAVSAVHGAVAVFGQVLKDLDDGVDDCAKDDGDVSISRITVNTARS